MQGKYGIFIRDKDGQLVDRLNDYSSLRILETLNDVGSWNIESRTLHPCPFEPGMGILVIRNGEYLYGGILESIQDTMDAKTGIYSWKIAGISDLGYLKRRICYVDPVTGSTTQRGHYTATGVLSTVVDDLIAYNLGTDALPARIEPIVERNEGEEVGETVSVSLRFQNLLSAVTSLCKKNGYNIRPAWDKENSKVYYEVFSGSNLTQDYIFSEQLNNITEAEYIANIPEANYVLAGGTGELTERQFATAQNAESIDQWGRIEKFQDARSENNVSSYVQEVIEKKSSNTVGYSCTASGADNAPQYRINYNLGDIVSMKIGSTYIAAEVQQVEISLVGGVETVSPRFGTLAVGKFREIFAKLSVIRDDVDELLGKEIE